jgi:hypothetical protein
VAYTLNVIQDMLEKVPEPARTVYDDGCVYRTQCQELRGSDGRRFGGNTLDSRRGKREKARY